MPAQNAIEQPDISLTCLNSFKKNVYSQFGEDGIIEEILERISASGSTDGWCVEFGAWDGMHLSNTCNLIRNKKYKAVLIEGDAQKYEELKKNIPQEDVVKVCRFVSFEGNNSLDEILRATPIPADFDFLSIDIDGCDYYIFESLTIFRPKIICVEFNPSIPNEQEFVQPRDFSIKQGASAKSLIKLGEQKGYSLVAVTDCNVFMVRNDFLGAVLGEKKVSLEELREDDAAKVFLFVGYDGTLLSNKKELKLMWHGTSIEMNKLQYLPSFLRTFSPDYSFWQKICFAIWKAFKR